MITACVADIYGWDDIVISQFRNMKSVSELILVKSGDRQDLILNYPDLLVKTIYAPHHGIYTHALHLHRALDRATNEYVFFSDSDVLYRIDAAEFYLSKMEEFDLKYIGISHYRNDQAFGSFPTVTSMLTKKSSLPGRNFLKGLLRLRPSISFDGEDSGEEADGMFLLQSAIPEYQSFFPNNKGNFDVGCNLWLWCEQQGYRWIGLEPLRIPESHNSYYYMAQASNFSQNQILFPPELVIFHKTMTRPVEDFWMTKRTWGL